MADAERAVIAKRRSARRGAQEAQEAQDAQDAQEVEERRASDNEGERGRGIVRFFDSSFGSPSSGL
jgi:hypothetical protein